MPAVSRLAGLARTPVARDLSITLGGRGVQMLLGLVGNVVSARALGPDDFGRFGLVIAAVTVVGTLADAGLTYTAVKFIAQHAEREHARAQAVARVYFLFRVISGALVALAGVLASGPIASLLGEPRLTPYLQLAFLTLLGLGLSSYPGTVLLALGKFGRLGAAGVANACITVAGILALLAAGALDLGGLIAWNVALPLVSTLPAWLLMPRDWLPWRLKPAAGQPLLPRDVTAQVLGFSKWMVISAVGSILVTQGDLLLLGRLAEPAVVGAYSVALSLALRLDLLNQSLLTVLLPRAGRLRDAEAVRRYQKRALGSSVALAGVAGLLALASQPLILLLYGERYAASAGLFLALLVVALFDLATSSLFLAAMPLNRPRVLAVADWLRVLVMGAAGLAFIPGLGGLGAALARGLARVAGAAYAIPVLRRAASPPAEGPDSAASSSAS